MTLERLGPYDIRRRLGRGGMGTVYEGVDRQTGQRVAVKLLSVGLAQDPGFRLRFETEIDTLRKLKHPHIVRLFGFGEQDECLFYAMELVPGSSLEEQLSRGRCFDWREVVRIAVETCRALRHAHDRGVIHRDIKPGNLLLTEDGHVKLSDFGIARLFSNVRVTSVGSVLGTAEYMAPEQAEGRPAGPRADLYSLGAVMYVLLARRPVFLGKSFAEIVEKQRFDRPEPLQKHAPDVPAELGQIIGELLEKDPERRPTNATLLSRRLESLEHALSVGCTPTEDGPAEGNSTEDDADIDLLAPTCAVTAPGEQAASGPREEAHEARTPERDASRATCDSAPALAAGEPSPDALATTATADAQRSQPPRPEGAKAAGRFTPVTPSELDRPEAERTATPWISPHTWALASGLIAVGLVVWYLLRPPTADALHARIAARTEAGFSEISPQVEDDIQQFLVDFPGDSRCEYLREKQKEIQLNRLERKLELRAKGTVRLDPLLPIEQGYLEALNYARLDPDLGIVKLQSLVDLYGQRQDATGPVGQCLELARRRLAQLREQLQTQSPEHLALVQDRINQADKLRSSEPARAEAMYRAVIELYQNRPWAAEAVRRARAALEKPPSPLSAAPGATGAKDEGRGAKGEK